MASTLGGQSWGKWLENKFLVFLGKYSYALYLTHALIIDLAVTIIPTKFNTKWFYFSVSSNDRFNIVGMVSLSFNRSTIL